MKLLFFSLLSKINALLLPRMWKKDLSRLSKTQKALIAWKIWVTYNYLELSKKQ